MRGSRFGFEYVPIRNYDPRPRDPEPQERPPRPPAQQVDETQSDGSYELVSEVADGEQLPQTKRHVQREGKHGAMAQWLCRHQVEMEMILAEIVETVFQSGFSAS